MGVLERVRKRREPEKTVLYRVLAEHLETFLARVEEDTSRGGLPWFVVRELRAFLDCGILARGFSRVHCHDCGKDALVAHSCKKRGFCPSCGARRMADTAAHLVDRVLPDVPVRQWVLALPHRVRFWCAYDPELCRGVRRIFVRAIASFYKRRAKDRGIHDPRTGCVVFAQRFDSALRLNLHFHSLWPDGVFRPPKTLDAQAEFEPDARPSDADIAHLARVLRDRIVRFLRKAGKLSDEDADALRDEFDEQPLLADIAAAATSGATALGPDAGTPTPRLGRGTADGGGGEFSRGKLCADCDGFSLHAGVRIPEFCRDRLEKLCRYAARPPVVHERMSLTANGKILYKLKRRYRDGSTHVVLDPHTLIERLAALVPRPRIHLTTYHGIFAPAASYRSAVVPEPPDDEPPTSATCEHATAPSPSAASADPPPPPATSRRRRYSWAELIKRVFLADVLICDRCGGARKILDFITCPAAIRKILAHLHLDTEAPPVAPARPPPEPALPYA